MPRRPAFLNHLFAFPLSLFFVVPLSASARPAEKGLKVETARERASRVSKVDYDLKFELSREHEDFRGAVVIDFALTGSGPLTVDFSSGTVLGLKVNDESLAPEYNGFFLTLPAESLKRGKNKVEIEFTHPYSKTGAGLYRSKDPKDERVYVYTDLEPYDANEVFPCFDQPDLKAHYTLQVRVPGSWTVISSLLEREALGGSDGSSLWRFPKSKLFSTYLFSLHAGPYRQWKTWHEDIPIRLFARESLADFVAVEEWFTITRQGLKFFGDYFDTPYPFDKYDQIIVPDFNAGAMENVAAVTFTEWYVHRGAPTRKQRERRASTILHEMAHMWFGDLVTMRWWDDLWLNESFASYMGNLALVEATEFKTAWESFFWGMKDWAYWEDQLVTTHPIEGPVPDTEGAAVSFDGITYGKGASVLKLMSYYLGADKFRKGARLYFKRHAFDNAVLEDFRQALEKGSKRKLGPWFKEWLQTAGLNFVKADFSCSDGKISEFKLLQSAPEELPTLRGHRAEIGLFTLGSSGKIEASAVIADIEYSGPETAVAAAVGLPCPLIVYPNHKDHDYVRVRLDEGSLKAARERLSDVEDDLSRAMLWKTLWDMVRDAEFGLPAYTDLVIEHAARETNVDLARRVVGTFGGVLGYLPVKGEGAGFREELFRRFEDFYWKQLAFAAPGSDFQKLWYDEYVSVASSPEALKRLTAILDGKVSSPGLEVDQDRRWDIVHRLSRRGHPGASALREAEKKKDASRRGQTASISAEVSAPVWEVKDEWLKKIVSGDPALKLADMKAAMSGMFPVEQTEFMAKFAPEFYKELPRLDKERSHEFLKRFTRDLAPTRCEQPATEELGKFLLTHEDLSPVVMKNLRVAKQEDERCLKVRKRALSEIKSL